MAKSKSTTRTASRTRRKAEPGRIRLCADPVKDEMMRRWAAKIASELPSSSLHEALVVLKYAERLIYWAVLDDPLVPPMKRGRATR